MIQLRREVYLDYLQTAKDMQGAVRATLERETGSRSPDDVAFFDGVLGTALKDISATSIIGINVVQGDRLVTRFNKFSPELLQVIEREGRVVFYRSSFPAPYDDYAMAFFTDRFPLPLPARVLGLQIALFVILVPCTFAALYNVGARNIRLSEDQLRLQMAAMVGHELQTPLTSLKMHVEMLQSGIVANEGDRDEYFRRLLSQVDRLSMTVRGMLTVSKPEACDRASLMSLPLPDVIERIQSDVEAIAAVFRISVPIEITSEETSNASVVIETDFLRSILGNLIENAIKYGGADNSGVLVRLRTISRHFEIAVVDFGNGFVRAERQNVFLPFYRGKQAKTVAASGTGLGLSVVKAYARRLGGTVRIEEATVGACVVVCLPME